MVDLKSYVIVVHLNRERWNYAGIIIIMLQFHTIAQFFVIYWWSRSSITYPFRMALYMNSYTSFRWLCVSEVSDDKIDDSYPSLIMQRFIIGGQFCVVRCRYQYTRRIGGVQQLISRWRKFILFSLCFPTCALPFMMLIVRTLLFAVCKIQSNDKIC